jgi:hypothetical protein
MLMLPQRTIPVKWIWILILFISLNVELNSSDVFTIKVQVRQVRATYRQKRNSTSIAIIEICPHNTADHIGNKSWRH